MLPSGDQEALVSMLSSFVVSLVIFVPSESITYMFKPHCSSIFEIKTILLPSGDQEGVKYDISESFCSKLSDNRSSTLVDSIWANSDIVPFPCIAPDSNKNCLTSSKLSLVYGKSISSVETPKSSKLDIMF